MVKPQRGVGNREAFHRMNFLHQAARLLSPSAPAAARQLSFLAVAIARKAVLRVDADIKRGVCKRCSAPLADGEGSLVRLRKKRLVISCLSCGWVKRYGLDKVPWGQRPEALVATTVFDGQKQAREEKDTPKEEQDTRTKEERRKDRIKKGLSKETEGKEGKIEIENEKLSSLQVNNDELKVKDEEKPAEERSVDGVETMEM